MLGRRRWLNRDPIEENGGENLYGFNWNNPVSLFDVDARISISDISDSLNNFFENEEIGISGGLGIVGGAFFKYNRTKCGCWSALDVEIKAHVGVGAGLKVKAGRLLSFDASIDGLRFESNHKLRVARNCDGSFVGGGKFTLVQANPGYFSVGVGGTVEVPRLISYSLGGRFKASIAAGLFLQVDLTSYAASFIVTVEGHATVNFDYIATVKIGSGRVRGIGGDLVLHNDSFINELGRTTIRF